MAKVYESIAERIANGDRASGSDAHQRDRRRGGKRERDRDRDPNPPWTPPSMPPPHGMPPPGNFVGHWGMPPPPGWGLPLPLPPPPSEEFSAGWVVPGAPRAAPSRAGGLPPAKPSRAAPSRAAHLDGASGSHYPRESDPGEVLPLTAKAASRARIVSPQRGENSSRDKRRRDGEDQGRKVFTPGHRDR